MSGMANVNSASRPHYASSIPVPRASSQTRIHTPGASPQLRPRQQADLALSPQRGASPRRGKAAVSSRNSSPKAYRGRGTPRAAGPARELAGSVESLPSSPWNSPRVTPKTALSSQAGSRRAGETQSTQRKKTQEGIPVRHTRGRSPPQSSCYGETQIPGPPEGRMPPGCQGKDQRNIISKPPRCLEPDEGEASGTSSPVCSPVQSMRSSATPGVISFSSAHPQSQPITATVAPFQYRLQTDQEPGPVPQESWVLDGYTSPPSRTEDSFSCMDARIVHALLAGRMLGSSVKSVQPEVELSGGSGSGGDEGADESRGASRKAAAADGRGMLPKRAKAAGGSGSMAKASAAELKVFKSGSVDSRVPGGLPTSNLRKQKSPGVVLLWRSEGRSITPVTLIGAIAGLEQNCHFFPKLSLSDPVSEVSDGTLSS